MRTKVITVKNIDAAYAKYLAAYESEKDTTVGALQQLAFKLQIDKGNTVQIGNVKFKA